MTLDSILGPDGRIAKALGEAYEFRPQQLEMANAVADAIAEGRHLMVEAGTGVGKSFAYLIPAILAAQEAERKTDEDQEERFRVVISTHTRNLQDQLIDKDIPFLHRVMPSPFRAAVFKGRHNYLSRRRLRVALERGKTLFEAESAGDQLLAIDQWAAKSREGTRRDLEGRLYQQKTRLMPMVWDQVKSDAGNCLRQQCADHGRCFYYQAKRSMQKVQILVVNHALFFTDLALKQVGRDLIGPYQVVILDEAHTLDQLVAKHYGIEITNGELDGMLRRLFSPKGNRGLLTSYETMAPELLDQVAEARNAAQDFFKSMQAWFTAQPRPRGGDEAESAIRVRQPNIVANPLSEELKKLATGLHDLAKRTKANEDELIELRAAGDRCREMANELNAWLTQANGDQVHWIEIEYRRTPLVKLCSAAVEVGDKLREQLFSQCPSVIMTSATLSTGGPHGFSLFQSCLGLDDCPSLQLGSPFNFAEQVELHLMKAMPDPTRLPREFEIAAIAKIKEYISRTKGRAFVLFTSTRKMKTAADHLRDWCASQGYPLLVQHEDGEPEHLLRRFKQAGNAVLLGVESFWQGVDVQGDALSNVIIVRLPFTPPSRPTMEARSEAIQAKGGNAFADYALPTAVLKLKQGFGRLIRTRTDRGMVVVLDPRIMTKLYGKRFLDGLPDCRRVVEE